MSQRWLLFLQITALSLVHQLPTTSSLLVRHHIHTIVTTIAPRATPRYHTSPHTPNDANNNSSTAGEKALSDLGLTADETRAVLQRCRPRTDGSYDGAALSWLAPRFSREALAAIVVGHPPVLTYDVTSNLGPTVEFYRDALSLDYGDGDSMDGDSMDGDSMDGTGVVVGARLASFLRASPGLFEYNVRKRLVPRLERVRAGLGVHRVDEECLRAIAIQTDSRFGEWLSLEERKRGSTADGAGIDGAEPVEQRDRVAEVERHVRSSHVIVSNLQSGGNIGNILRSASIFGCEECIVVGQKRHRLTGDHGARFDLPRRHLYSHADARSYLHGRGVRIYGVEITPDAKPIVDYDPETGVMRFPFDVRWQGAAFVMGNEGGGMSDRQREICDEFVYIPQTRGGSQEGGGSASLNVACAATVVLQAYRTWAGYPEAERDNEKFVAGRGESERLRYRDDS